MALTCTEMLREIIDNGRSGLTQAETARRLQDMGYRTMSGAHVGAILRGQEPRYGLGSSIRDLYIDECCDEHGDPVQAGDDDCKAVA